jgi:hypothetical protein
MHPAVEELRRLVPPPETPNGADGDWGACERDLGLRLPADYKEFISTYGSGTLCRLFEIPSPFSARVGALGADLRLLGGGSTNPPLPALPGRSRPAPVGHLLPVRNQIVIVLRTPSISDA